MNENKFKILIENFKSHKLELLTKIHRRVEVEFEKSISEILLNDIDIWINTDNFSKKIAKSFFSLTGQVKNSIKKIQ